MTSEYYKNVICVSKISSYRQIIKYIVVDFTIGFRKLHVNFRKRSLTTKPSFCFDYSLLILKMVLIDNITFD